MSKKETLEKFFKFMEKWHYEDFNAFENHFNKLMSMKSKEQLTNENDALKDSIAVILAQKKNVHKHCDEKDQQIDQLKQQLDQANERLKGAIVPKFKVGQEVYYYHIARNKIYLGLIEDIQYFATRCSIFYRIPNLQRDYFWIREDELFATEQEAQAKLQEL